MFYDILIYTPMYVTLFWAITLLLSDRKKNLAKFFLGVFMLAAFLIYISHAIFLKGDQSLYLYFDPLYTFASLLVYPLYYVYIKILSVTVFFNKKNWIHFAPAFILATLSTIIYLVMPISQRAEYVNSYFFNGDEITTKTTLQHTQRFIYILSRIIFSIQVIYFLIKGTNYIKTYNKHIANFYSNIEEKSIVWVNLLLGSFVVTSLMSVIFNSIGKYYFLDSPILLVIPSTIFSLLLFTIGFQGFMQNHSVRDLVLDKKETPILLPQTNHKKLKEHLKNHFENTKIYRNPELKITDVSLLLHTNRTYLSKLINTDFNCSFSDYVNRYRIQEAKKILSENTTTNYTLEYISEQVGFGSLHSFIRVFKKFVGCTPGNYRLQHTK